MKPPNSEKHGFFASIRNRWKRASKKPERRSAPDGDANSSAKPGRVIEESSPEGDLSDVFPANVEMSPPLVSEYASLQTEGTKAWSRVQEAFYNIERDASEKQAIERQKSEGGTVAERSTPKPEERRVYPNYPEVPQRPFNVRELPVKMDPAKPGDPSPPQPPGGMPVSSQPSTSPASPKGGQTESRKESTTQADPERGVTKEDPGKGKTELRNPRTVSPPKPETGPAPQRSHTTPEAPPAKPPALSPPERKHPSERAVAKTDIAAPLPAHSERTGGIKPSTQSPAASNLPQERLSNGKIGTMSRGEQRELPKQVHHTRQAGQPPVEKQMKPDTARVPKNVGKRSGPQPSVKTNPRMRSVIAEGNRLKASGVTLAASKAPQTSPKPLIGGGSAGNKHDAEIKHQNTIASKTAVQKPQQTDESRFQGRRIDKDLAREAAIRDIKQRQEQMQRSNSVRQHARSVRQRSLQARPPSVKVNTPATRGRAR